jgi:hypothetical protein
MPLGTALFGAIAAKCFAERARDVGQNTVVTLLKSGLPIIHLNDDEIASVRQAWEHLPKYSDEVVKALEKRMEETDSIIRAHLRGEGQESIVVNALKMPTKPND